jgi:hypothetical protein
VKPSRSMLLIGVLGPILVILVSISLIIIIALSHSDARNTQAQSLANNAIIKEIRTDLSVHARASADRNCAVANELRYLIGKSLEVKDRVLARTEAFTKGACQFVPPHITGGG